MSNPDQTKSSPLNFFSGFVMGSFLTAVVSMMGCAAIVNFTQNLYGPRYPPAVDTLEFLSVASDALAEGKTGEVIHAIAELKRDIQHSYEDPDGDPNRGVAIFDHMPYATIDLKKAIERSRKNEEPVSDHR